MAITYQSADTGGRTTSTLAAVAKGIGQGIQSFANHSAQAASRANGVSAAAQAAQGKFNQESANLANSIATDRIADQYAFNSGMAADANQFSLDSWNQAAAWNEAMWQKNADWQEKMWQKSADFNHQEAEIARGWQEEMMRTAYQRAVKDMSAAGLNPILAVTGGGISTGSGSGTAASIGSVGSSAPTMSALAGHSASGGLLNGLSASEGNYTGQMEYVGGMLGLLSAALGGISSAIDAMSQMGIDKNSDFLTFIKEMFLDNDQSKIKYRFDHSKVKEKINDYKSILNHNRWANGDYNPADNPKR